MVHGLRAVAAACFSQMERNRQPDTQRANPANRFLGAPVTSGRAHRPFFHCGFSTNRYDQSLDCNDRRDAGIFSPVFSCGAYPRDHTARKNERALAEEDILDGLTAHDAVFFLLQSGNILLFSHIGTLP